MFRTKIRNSHVFVKVLCGPSNLLKLTRGCFSERYGQDLNQKIVPKLIYLHNPWMYMFTKFQLLRLRFLWDRHFIEDEFIRGSKQRNFVVVNAKRQIPISLGNELCQTQPNKIGELLIRTWNGRFLNRQRAIGKLAPVAITTCARIVLSYLDVKKCLITAAIVMSNSIRDQDGIKIEALTTPVGFQQITRDMILSRNDIRLKLIHFRVEDIHRAIPMKVILCKKTGRKYCLIDMVFVAMRNIKDFTNSQESQLIRESVYKLDREMKICHRVLQVPHRILFAEMYIRFYRDYSLEELENWKVSFYKIIAFDVLNYNPK